jgi:hypothetical protein
LESLFLGILFSIIKKLKAHQNGHAFWFILYFLKDKLYCIPKRKVLGAAAVYVG